MPIEECECIMAGYCNRHKMHKSQQWVALCQNKENYRKAWDKGTGPGQQSEPEDISCPHLSDTCLLISEISGTPYKPTPSVCNACTKSERSQRLNYTTLSIIVKLNPDLDISKLESIIDETSGGVGTKLARVFNVILPHTAGCGCNGRQDILDTWTPTYIKENIEKVVDWLQQEARNRQLPFSRLLAKTLLLGIIKTTK